ncbi:hypothetical protein Acsp04_31550 [Actinomadura sp. NBRC 104425]|nr:hypothetical protein Acsp04_31550 [Actinomadura sp. NBRC 104425]
MRTFVPVAAGAGGGAIAVPGRGEVVQMRNAPRTSGGGPVPAAGTDKAKEPP